MISGLAMYGKPAALSRGATFSIMRSAWKRLGVKSLIGKSQPVRTLQRGLTYTLILRGIWAQFVMVQEYVFFEARSLIDNAPAWKNDQASCSLGQSRSLF